VAGYPFAICNEIYRDIPFQDVCQSAKSLGYEGIELAPHTLAEDATRLSAEERALIRQQISDAGLDFVGLHWLLVSPPGLHITSADRSVRRRSWDYVHRAIDLCSDLGSDLARNNGDKRALMVFGSPKQRSTRDGMPSPEGVAIFAEELALAAPQAESRNVTLLVEAIPSAETDVVTTLAEAVAVVQRVDSPAVETMFDVHNTADETEPHGALLRKYSARIRHVHVNEPNGQEPGMGSYDFGALLNVLAELRYPGWVSVEAFDFTRPPEEIARRAIDCLKLRTARAIA
jgi:D-psicose/D-tagatose/L-ribulose 3-epimerase